MQKSSNNNKELPIRNTEVFAEIVPSTSSVVLHLNKLKKSKKKVTALKTNNISTSNTLNTENSTAENQLEEKKKDGKLKYGAAHVILLFVPVSLCMAVVIFTMSTIGYFSRDDEVYLFYTPFTKKTDDAAELFVMSLGNAMVLLVFIICSTCLLIILYKFRFYKIIYAWLILSSLTLLSVFTLLYIQEVLKNYNVPMDYITILMFIWNYSCLGMICIYWKGPLIMQQFYLIILSALMALIFIKFMPEWTVWMVLAVISIWDLIAVLCPKGPLRILVKIAHERNESIFPSLIYSSAMLYTYFLLEDADSLTNILKNKEEKDSILPVSSLPTSTMSESKKCYISLSQNEPKNSKKEKISNGVPQNNEILRKRQLKQHQKSCSAVNAPILESDEVEEIEERGVKLGLGDFIFYSVLIGKASSSGDWNTIVACYVAILVGLAFTLMLLALFRKALPALPISISAGIIFHFATREIMTPFTSELALRRYLL